jgi:RimJ/RimL family protein N-acetyltransferase
MSPRIPRLAGIAQLVERVIRNDEVVGSIPISGTRYFPDCRRAFVEAMEKPASAGFFLPCSQRVSRGKRMASAQDIVIETARLRLDRLEGRDAPVLFEYRGDDAVARYQGWRPADPAEAGAFIESQRGLVFGTADSWCQLAIRERATGELAGDLGVHFPASTQDAIEFGISLRPARQGRGYAREAMAAVLELAFGEWGYRRSVGSVDPRNIASIALLRSLGFRQEAHHVESYFFRGEWVDDVIFAMLDREWRRPG